MTNDDYSIGDLRAYGLILRAGGISAAAREHAVSKASLSRSLARVEAAAGAPLFDRVGRGLKPTPLGESLRAIGARAVELAGEADDALRSARGTPGGPLRIAASTLTAYQLLSPVLGRFALDHPEVAVTLRADAQGLDPMSEDLDIVFRIGQPDDERLVARRIVSSPLRLYTGRAMADAHDVDDVDVVRALGRVVIDVSGVSRDWTLAGADGRTLVLDGEPLLGVGDPIIAFGVLLSGVGIACLPAFHAERFVADGRLVRVLPSHEGSLVHLFATLPPRRSAVPAVRAFIDRLVDHADALDTRPPRSA